jgi:hypothetical protein
MQRLYVALGLLLVFGLAIRLALGWYQSSDLLADNDGYIAHAKPVAAGAGFHGPYTNRPTAFRPPGYPVLLGALMALGASDSAAVAIASLMSCLVIFALTRTLALQCGVDPYWSLLAVLGVTIDPLLVRYSILPMTEVPCAAILLAAIVAFLKFLNSRCSKDGASIQYGVLSGVLFGVGTLIRPVVMIVCAFLTLYAFSATWRDRKSGAIEAGGCSGWCRRLLITSTPAIVAGLVLCPWVIRNAICFHHFIPATTHGGYTLALGNNPDFYRDVVNGQDEFPWEGPALDAWQKRMILESGEQGLLTAGEPAVDAWYYSQATAAIQAEPRSFLKATALRLRRFWAISTASSPGGHSLVTGLVMIWYGILWIGLILQVTHAWSGSHSPGHRSLALLWLTIMAFVVMHSVYWTDTRMRAPVMPLMIVISVSGWQSVATSMLRRAVKC